MTPAGWYTDPSNAGLVRYWDGSRWTEHTAPAVTAPAPTAPYGYPGGPPPSTAAPTNGLAVAALVTSLVGLGPVAVILGHVSLSQIKRSRGGADGRGLAIAGLVIGYIETAFVALAIVAAIGVFAIGTSTINSQQAACRIEAAELETAAVAARTENRANPSAHVDWNTFIDPGHTLRYFAVTGSMTGPAGVSFSGIDENAGDAICDHPAPVAP